MRGDRPRDPGSLTGLPTGALDREPGDRLSGPLARKQPFSGMGRLPIISENAQQPGREHHVAVFPAFARLRRGSSGGELLCWPITLPHSSREGPEEGALSPLS